MGYGEKVKKWFFDEEGDEYDVVDDNYDAVEVDTEPKRGANREAHESTGGGWVQGARPTRVSNC